MMRALVTRPEEDAGAVAAALRARGIEPVIEPMLSVAPESADAISLDGVQAILFSSANAVREFARRETRRDVAVYAVGDASARAARNAGFANVKSAGRDAAALAKLVAADLRPANGALLHPRGRDTTGHLESALRAAGFELRDPVVYRAEAAQRLSEPVKRMLADGGIEFALFFSPRTARSFVTAVQDAGLTGAMRKLAAVCLSQAVADALAPLAFAKVTVAASPNQDSLLAALPAAAKAPRRTWLYAAAGIAAVIVIAAIVWAVQRQDVASPAAPREDPRLAEMQREINALQARIQAAPAQLSGVAAAQGERIQGLQDRLATLDGRVATLEERAKKGTVAGAELLIATAVLRDAVARGDSYAAPLDAVASLAKDDSAVQAAVAALRPGAGGLPIAPMLASRIEPVADAIARAALAPPGSNWFDRLWARISSLVTVRRSGADATGDSADALAARAEAKAKSGDLAGAVAELEKLTGAPAEAARPWLAQARARLAADKAVDDLSALALQRLDKAG